MSKKMKKNFRKAQLRRLGWISILIAPTVWFFASVVHEYPFPSSISETGTMANTVAPLLPLALGALALFSFSYAKECAHDTLDKILPRLMGSGFLLVAIQMCESAYIESARVGLFGLTQF